MTSDTFTVVTYPLMGHGAKSINCARDGHREMLHSANHALPTVPVVRVWIAVLSFIKCVQDVLQRNMIFHVSLDT